MSNDQHPTKRYWRQTMWHSINDPTFKAAVALLEKGYLCTRWFELLDWDDSDHSLDTFPRITASCTKTEQAELKKRFKKLCENAKNAAGEPICNVETGGKITKTECLLDFLSIERNDIVMVHSRANRFGLYRVIEPACRVSDLPVEDLKAQGVPIGVCERGNLVTWDKDGQEHLVKLGFFLRVERLGDGDYASKASGLMSAFKYAQKQPTRDVTEKYSGLIEAVLRGEAPEIRSIQAIRDADDSNEGLTRANDTIRAVLNSDVYERLVCWYFDKRNAESGIPTKNGSGKSASEKADETKGDVDVIATFDSDHIYLVQVKFFNGEKPMNGEGKKGVEQVYRYCVEHAEQLKKYEHIHLWVVCSTPYFADEDKRRAVRLSEEIPSGIADKITVDFFEETPRGSKISLCSGPELIREIKTHIEVIDDVRDIFDPMYEKLHRCEHLSI